MNRKKSKIKQISSESQISYPFFLEFNKKLEQNKELGEIMNLIIRYRGTELEEQFQTKYKEKLEEIDKKSKYV